MQPNLVNLTECDIWRVIFFLTPDLVNIFNICSCFIVCLHLTFQALFFAGKEPFPTIYVDSQKEGEVGLDVQLFSNCHLSNCITYYRL